MSGIEGYKVGGRAYCLARESIDTKSANDQWMWHKSTLSATSCLACPAGTHASSSLTSVENDETSCYCAASQVSNSNKAATNSITGIIDSTTTVKCDEGHY